MATVTYSFVTHSNFLYGGPGTQTRPALTAIRNAVNDGWVLVWEESDGVEGDFFNIAGDDDISLVSPLASVPAPPGINPGVAQSNAFSASGAGGPLLLAFTDDSSGTARIAARALSGLDGNPISDKFILLPHRAPT